MEVFNSIAPIVVSSLSALLAALFGARVGGKQAYKIARWQANIELYKREKEEAERGYGGLLVCGEMLVPTAVVPVNYIEGLKEFIRHKSQLRWVAPKDVKMAIEEFLLGHNKWRENPNDETKSQLLEKLRILKQNISDDIENKSKRILHDTQ